MDKNSSVQEILIQQTKQMETKLTDIRNDLRKIVKYLEDQQGKKITFEKRDYER
jgi:hypothetical protein